MLAPLQDDLKRLDDKTFELEEEHFYRLSVAFDQMFDEKLAQHEEDMSSKAFKAARDSWNSGIQSSLFGLFLRDGSMYFL